MTIREKLNEIESEWDKAVAAKDRAKRASLMREYERFVWLANKVGFHENFVWIVAKGGTR